MSDVNGAVTSKPEDASESATPTNRVKDVTAEEMYAQMGKLCSVKRLNLKKKTVKGVFTQSVESFPKLTGGSFSEAAEAGLKTGYKPTTKVDGAEASASGYAEGDDAVKLSQVFRKLVTID